MLMARNGDTVKVHYRGTLEDGTVFDSSEGLDPVEFVVGGGQVIPGFENAIVGMVVGQKKSQAIPVDQAYGEYREDLVFHVEKANIEQAAEVEVGDVVNVVLGDGQNASMTVTEVDDDSVTLDANHPLAGQNLRFDLELVSIG